MLRDQLFPLAECITPNLPEAAALLDEPLAESEAEMAAQGRRLLAFGARAVLIKGGHAAGPDSRDVLVDASGTRWFSAPRHATQNTHGTGCTLSSAIAALLARGATLDAAVADAKTYLTAAIKAGDELSVGHGAGPVHHFHALWPRPACSRPS
jgi:hydroxymethylpyrimidine/phosphomethylpyrimidine kinase